MALTAYDQLGSLPPRIASRRPRIASPGASPAPVARPLDLATAHRRRRMVAASLLLALLVSLGYLAAVSGLVTAPSPASAPAGPSSPVVAEVSVYVVQPGDTLWSIARELQPAGDIRPVVDRLASIHGAALQVGDRIDLSALT